MNPPSASHLGGVWERQIHFVRAILRVLLQGFGQQMINRSEPSCAKQRRQLILDGLTTLSSPEPLTPNHLLTIKTNALFPPPGDFKRADLMD